MQSKHKENRMQMGKGGTKMKRYSARCEEQIRVIEQADKEIARLMRISNNARKHGAWKIAEEYEGYANCVQEDINMYVNAY